MSFILTDKVFSSTSQNSNNSLVLTTPARRSFKIIARHKGFVLCLGFVLPVKARARPHKLGVRLLILHMISKIEQKMSINVTPADPEDTEQ